MKVFVLGGDGFCGWPCAVNLADKGHDVFIVDNLSRRKIDIDLEVESLTPITRITPARAKSQEPLLPLLFFVSISILGSFAKTLSLP